MITALHARTASMAHVVLPVAHAAGHRLFRGSLVVAAAGALLGVPAALTGRAGDPAGVPTVPATSPRNTSPASTTPASTTPASTTPASTTPTTNTTPTTPASTMPAGWRVPGTVTRVISLGDSIALQSLPTLRRFATPMKVADFTFGGTAPCDWLDRNLHTGPDSLLVISFSGNSLTACMADGAGGHLSGAALVARYRADVLTLVDRARSTGAWVVLVGQAYSAPEYGTDDRIDGLNDMYRELARRFPYVAFVDAGAAVEAPDGTYAARLTCQLDDIDCAPDGTTQVRSDGIHFCAVPKANPCPVYSSGARRFGTAVAAAVLDPARYD